MEIIDLITPETTVAKLSTSSKKQVLQEMSRLASIQSGIHEREILDVLMERERLGTTGVGNGIAIPHGKISGLEKLFGVFCHLDQPVDFQSIDDGPVDLIFMLLAPEQAGADHLKALARISRLLRDRTICEKLRGTNSSDALYAILIENREIAA